MMPPKKKSPKESINPMVHPSVPLDYIPPVGRDCEIFETQCEFDIFEFYCWLEDKFIDKIDEI